MSAKIFFDQQQREVADKLEEQRKVLTRFSLLRLITFLILVGSIYLIVSRDLSAYWLPVVSFLGFFWAILRYQKVEKEISFLRFLKDINSEDTERQQGKFAKVSNGTRFVDESHPYSVDLDVFGESSVFHHVNRCELESSEDLLASYLTVKPDLKAAQERQKTVQWLSQKVAWSQELRAILRPVSDVKKGISLGAEKPLYKGVVGIAWLFRLVGISLTVSWLIGMVPGAVVLLSVFINMLFLGLFQSRIMTSGDKLSKIFQVLLVYRDSLSHIGKLDTDLTEIRDARNSSIEGVRQIGSLSHVIHLLDARSNMFYWLFNQLLLIDVYLWQSLGDWRKANEFKIDHWLNAIHTMEALSSLAGYAFVNSSFVYPTLQVGSDLIVKGVGHPLLPEGSRVFNDYAHGQSKVALITGSNMSGKSTFLRTIGLSVVMGWSGLPVCAQQATLGHYLVFSSMRTHDDLSSNTSSFYAELRRIKQLLDLIQKEELPVLFLLDEILKGTNSVDRHAGAQGLIDKLVLTESFGFISTHDLELADQNADDDLIENWSFNSRIEDNELIFDYMLTPGKCQGTNASVLMKNIGIL